MKFVGSRFSYVMYPDLLKHKIRYIVHTNTVKSMVLTLKIKVLDETQYKHV